MKFSGVIFDLDGTLLDTVEALAWSMNEILAKHQYPKRTIEEYKSYIGNGVKALVEQALPPGTDQSIAHMMYEEKSLLYHESWKEGTKLFPDILPLINALSSKHIALGVFSNKEDEFTQEIVSYFFAHIPFIGVTGRSDTVPKKPDPTGLLWIMNKTNIPKNQWCYVGDKQSDIDAARNAGIVPIWVHWGYETKSPAQVQSIRSPMELLEFCS